MITKLLIILTGKTASGKDTIMANLLARYPNLKRVVSTTSRLPRNGEKNGIDYNFVSREIFQQKIKNGDFIEYVEYGGNLYGSEKSQIMQVLDADAIWRIDPSRAGEVRDFIKRAFPSRIAEKLIKKVTVIYITVPDEVVLQRLKGRGLLEGEIQKRMEDDAKIWKQYQDSYDFVVENVSGKLDQTVDKIINIIETQKRAL